MDYDRLSRTIAHALRHAPATYGLEMDPDGWVPVNDLLTALRAKRRNWRDLERDDLAELIERSDKRRYELQGARIRALYGHSISRRVERPAARPPDLLYHGTTPQAAGRILAEGLRPHGRQYAHLSATPESAAEVGRRRTESPTILTIHAARAHQNGVAFYRGNGEVWLADEVPPTYINDRPM